MRCEKCGIDYSPQLERCPSCGASAAHGGKTEFYGKAVNSKVSILDFFNGMFDKHPKGTAVRLFMSGTPETTPRADQMLAQWQKPWLFFRLLVIGIVFILLCGVMIYMNQLAGYTTLWTIGSLIIPITILTFYWEINIPRDIPIYTVAGVFFIGGVLSLVITLVMSAVINSSYGQYAWFAPVYEEPAKLLAAFIFIKKVKPKYGFGGLLLGGAVGAGFAAFENIMYVIVNMDTELFFTRALLSFGGHTVWAAMYCGALVLEKGSGSSLAACFLRPRFWIYFGAAFGLHFLWNSCLFGIWFNVVLTIAAIVILFTLIRTCLKQVVQTAEMARFNPNVPPVSVSSGSRPAPTPTPYPQQNYAPAQNAVPQQNYAPQQNTAPPQSFALPQQNYAPAQNAVPQQSAAPPQSFAPPQQSYAPQQSAAPPQSFAPPQQSYAPQQNYAPAQNAAFQPGSAPQRDVMQELNITPQQGYPAQPQMPATVALTRTAQLLGISGALQGRTVDFSDEIVIGRDPAQCGAVLPADTPGVSRKHCSVRLTGDSAMITDHGSSSGTFLADGRRVPAGQYIPLNGAFYLGSRQNMFSVNIK